MIVISNSSESQKNFEIQNLKKKVALQLVDYSLEIQEGDTVLIYCSPAGEDLCTEVTQLIEQRSAECLIQFVGADVVSSFSKCNKFLLIKERLQATDDGSTSSDIDHNKEKMEVILSRLRAQKCIYCFISVPTPDSVRPENMTFEDYSLLYYRACDRPWKKIEEVQKLLVQKCTGKSEVKIFSPPINGFDESWATNLRMNIYGQIPVNSVARRNMPGSEVFMSPNIHIDHAGIRKGTLNGVLAVPYPVYFKEKLLANLRLVFKDGKIVDWSTTSEDILVDYVRTTLLIDDGASWCGEFGIGTNPIVTIPVPDTLLTEKSLGIHLALGSAYTYTDYFGQKVNVDNGNRSANHIDIARIMTKAFGGGTITVDNEQIFCDGRFTDKDLELLN